MAIDSGDGGGGKIQRVDALRAPGDGALSENIPVDRISLLPDELRQHLLTHLPLKDAIRTGALARGWRDLWKSRWEQRSSSVEVHLRSRDAPQTALDALEREPRPRRRLDRFSLIVDTCKLSVPQFRRFMKYAAECRVEDLHVEARRATAAHKLRWQIPLTSPLLARLSLRSIAMSNLYYKGAQPLQALEVIRLHSVFISNLALKKLIALCPSLLTLDVHRCKGDIYFSLCHRKLRSVTVAECDRRTHLLLRVGSVPSLRSFRYSGSFAAFDLPVNAVLADLHLCFRETLTSVEDFDPSSARRRIDWFHNTLPNDLSGLTVLTVCSNVLPVASSLVEVEDRPFPQMPKMSNLYGLRELQLLMRKMEAVNLADIYMFLKTCRCHNLERLFVLLPKFRNEPMEASLDEVGEEPPNIGLDNLKIVKVLNFSWCCTEVRLVSFLLRKASFLHKLLIVSRNVTPLYMPGVHDEDLLLLKEAVANGKIMLREADDDATQPYHSEVFIEL